jgi:hypothetical protein
LHCSQKFLLFTTEFSGPNHEWLEQWVTQDKEGRVVHHDEPLQLWVQWLDDQDEWITAGRLERCLRWAQVMRVARACSL